MRVIAGKFRSRHLKSVSGRSVRPTPDRLRESLFNILAPTLAGKVFLDAYAGSGSVGIEAFSRGAAKVILIEKSSAAVAVIHENLEALGIRQGIVVARGAAVRLLPGHPCDIAFIDPPYDQVEQYAEAMSALAATQCSLVIAQHESRLILPAEYGRLRSVRVVRQGGNSLTFFELTEEC